MVDDPVQKLRAIRNAIGKEYHVQALGVFGSYARDEADERSDLDVLVEFERPIGLFAFIRLERELSEYLHVKVDLVSKAALKPYIRERVLRETVYV